MQFGSHGGHDVGTLGLGHRRHGKLHEVDQHSPSQHCINHSRCEIGNKPALMSLIFNNGKLLAASGRSKLPPDGRVANGDDGRHREIVGRDVDDADSP